MRSHRHCPIRLGAVLAIQLTRSSQARLYTVSLALSTGHPKDDHNTAKSSDSDSRQNFSGAILKYFFFFPD